MSSCNMLVQLVVYLITPLPRLHFTVFLTFESLENCFVSALSHFTAFAAEAEKGLEEFASGCLFGLRIIISVLSNNNFLHC